ncbi:unnamed protein product [Adineta steineri]|uniref:LTD domain-containing protein n=1 Tax=Adineta steineri TaxID=433720 RepID=A0A819B536_9BILA|nr:unnamed protein product [Adineta steineri]CAF3795129.1 unnamed protein product [Adineta steineri]
MALIQRYTTELSTHSTVNRHVHDEKQSVEHSLQNVANIKRQDDDEKRYLHSLNDRLEDLLHSLDELEKANIKLRDDLNLLILNWGIGGENRLKFLEDLDQIIKRLGEQNRQKIIFQAEAKIFDEQSELIDRVSVVFVSVVNLYRDKCQILFELTNELEEELRKIRLRLDLSNTQVKAHDDDYQKELAKFRSYLAEWSQLALDKQYLLNEIQSLKERYNLRLAYNQEEINEWQRLLNRISQESKNYYRDYLDTIKQKIQMDYEQMAKDQQIDIEIKLKSRLNEMQEKIHMGLPLDDADERRRHEESQRFESRLDESTKEYDRLQNDYQILAEEMQRKRRILRNLENDLRTKARQHAEEHARLEHNTSLTRAEYYALKDELDKLAYTLRFSVEEELRIYEALLNSLNRRKEDRVITDDSRFHQTTTKRFTETLNTEGDTINFRKSQPNLSETSRTFVTQTNISDTLPYRPPPLLSETITTTKNFTDTFNTGGDSSGFRRSQPSLSETSRTFTTQTNINESTKYPSSPFITETKTIKQEHDTVDKPSNQWSYETISSSSTHGDVTDRDRSVEKTTIPTRTDADLYGIQQNLIDQNRTTTTTRTTKRIGGDASGRQSAGISSGRKSQVITSDVPELDEKFLQSKIHITRKYKGNILIKFVDVSGRFVEIENTGNQPRDLTGWYIERIVDDQRIEYTFPIYELGPHRTVRVYGNYHRRSSSNSTDQHLQLIAPNFYDWGNGRQMRTELFNRDDVGKALFEQTIKD